MGIGFLKKLIQEAKESKDVITLEATVITGFEAFALEECKEKLRPLSSNRSKGRIFFNIKKDAYPNVLKMRMIDNVFLVSESFEELKLKKIKDEDLLTIKNLVEQVDWRKSVPQWAEIVGFKGVQFPKCAGKELNEPLDENEPACQNCLKAKKGGGEIQAQDGGGSSVKNGDSIEAHLDSPKLNLTSDEQVFQTPPDKFSALNGKIIGATESTPIEDGIERAEVQKCSPLEMPPRAQLLEPKETEVTDDESAFHSAEEGPLIEEQVSDSPAAGDPLDQVRCSEVEILASKNDLMASRVSVCSDQTNSDGSLNQPASGEGFQPKQAKYEKQRSKQDRRRRARKERNLNPAKVESVDAAKHDPQSHGPDDAESNDAFSQTGSEPTEGPAEAVPKDDRRKNYWQKRREAKARKDAEGKAKKPPRKPYVDDGIMKFRVTCYRNGPKHSFDSNDAAGHFGGHINDKFHWTVDLTRHDINVVLVIEEDSAYVTLALTNKSLHKRNIKHFGPTTLRATLCYGLMRLAEPCTGDIVMDPMCGGGSIPIEGALAFPKTYHICGDVNEKRVAQTGDNIAHNSKEKPLLVDAHVWSVRRLPIRDSVVDVFVTDLPFGLRVGKQKDNTGLYIATLTEVARVVRTCGRASLLTYDKTAMIRALQRTHHLWREIRVQMVNQGGLRCFAYLLLRKARVSPLMDSAAPAQQLPELGLQVPGIPEPEAHPGEPSSEPSGPNQDVDLLDPPTLDPELPRGDYSFTKRLPLALQNEETPELNDLPAESPIAQPDPDEKCSDDTKRA